MRGKKFVRPMLLGAFALSTLAAVGCAGEAMRYNNNIAGYNKRLNEAGKRLSETLAPALKGGNANAGEVKAAYDQVVSTLNQVKTDFAALKTPAGASGKKFADAYAQFLKGQERAVQNELAQAVKLVESGRAERGQLGNLLTQVGQKEVMDLQALKAAQGEFAKEHGIALRPAQ